MSEIRVDTISEKTSANGVTIDGLTIKDGGIKGTGGQSLVVGSTDGTSARLVLDATNGDASGGDFPVITADGTSLNITANNSGGDAFMTFQTNSGEDMRIGPNGKVGIGNAAPANTLDISNTAATDKSLRLGQSGGTGNANANLILSSGGTGSSMIRFDYEGTNTDRARIGVTTSGQALQFFTAGDNERMKIDSTGAVTMPAQPAFLATVGTTQTNIADGHVVIVADTEIFDQNADYNTSNYTFTAPVGGKYAFMVNITTSGMPTDYHWIYCYIGTSNRTCFVDLIDPRMHTTTGSMALGGSILVDMDANDTALLYIRSSAHGSNTLDVVSNAANPETYFSGYLVA